jgi:hypothetical protein
MQDQTQLEPLPASGSTEDTFGATEAAKTN